MILGRSRQTGKGLRGCGARIGFKPALNAQVDQSIGLLATGSYNAARAVIFERAPHQHLIIGQKRSRQSIALKAGHNLAIEGEGKRFGAVDQPAMVGKTGAHWAAPFLQKLCRRLAGLGGEEMRVMKNPSKTNQAVWR